MYMQAEKITNHAVADTLDSSEAFEGPEKTLRITFAKTEANQPTLDKQRGLLDIPRKEWEAMLDLVKCKVLSVLVHPHVHAYVLSESSLFVYPRHIILKTCGTTTLLQGLSAILSTVEKYHEVTLVEPTVTAAFYSRRSYFNPEKQPQPHGSWADEVAYLKQTFKEASTACKFGEKHDEKWHLFTYTRVSELDIVESVPLNGGWLEMMMTGLDEELASRFENAVEPGGHSALENSVVSLDSMTSISSSVGAEPDDDDPGHHNGNIMTHRTRIDQLFNTTKQCIDSFAFTPCGYSCNGILLDSGDYFTIHVTPEQCSSYASFETSVGSPGSFEEGLAHEELVNRVLEIFEPEKLALVLAFPENKENFDMTSIFGGKYTCTSKAEINTGTITTIHVSLEKQP